MSVESGSEKNSDNYIDILTQNVNKLYESRDHYFENHSIEDAIYKNDFIEKQLQNVLIDFKTYEEAAVIDRAIYNYLKGRALNITPEYNKDAEDILSKAVKLNPKLVSAWNELGECYWKNSNLKEAKNCFLGALSHEKNKISLRNLSIVIRQEQPKSREEQIQNIQTGVGYAKEAVQLDTHDGVSWTVLGNAHLSFFFTVSQNPKILKLAKSAYIQAEKDIICKNNPELHYNRAVALKYEENYELALESFRIAYSLDPTWDMPKIKKQDLLKYLDDVQDFVNNNGKMKTKKLEQILKSIKVSQLGPYLSNKESAKLTLVPLSLLSPDVNKGKIIQGKVVCSVQNPDSVPFTFCLIDDKHTCMAITVYNLAPGKGVIIGDSVAIPEPFLNHINFTYEEKIYNFKSIRVDTPVMMIVNSRRVGKDQEAGTELTTFIKYS